MSTKTTAKRPESPISEIVSKRVPDVNARTLPAVSPIQQKPAESKAEPVQKQAEEEEPLQGKFDPVQKQGVEEEPLQGKLDPVQKMGEEEEPLQGKFDPVQKMGEEEEPLQGKFDPVQKMGEEEEPLQGKFDPVQKMGEEEEPLQGKFDPVQKMGEEEEPLQGKFDPVQKMGEEEEPLQGKFDPVQKQGEEEEPMQGKFDPVQKKAMNTVQLEGSDSAITTAKSENKTGLPDNLKSGIESLSGVGISDVKVHYNSDKPKQLKALAYAQGTDIHVGPGQEKHVPHEAWHVVQQKQGRVKPTMQMKQGVPVNDDAGLENEADVMGAKALAKGNEIGSVQKKVNTQLKAGHSITIQRKGGLFGESYSEVKDENPELAPGMGIMESGIEMSGKGAMAGAKKSWDIAKAPAEWASEGYKGTDSKLKKAGYATAGALGSIGSGIVGGIGAIGSGVAGLTGAAVSGIGGAITAGLGGLWKLAKTGASLAKSGIIKGASAAKNGIMGLFSDDKKKSEKASNALLLTSAMPMAGGSFAGLANTTKGFTGDAAPNAKNGFAGGLSGSGQAIAGLGAATDILGAGSAIAAATAFAEDAADGSYSKSRRVEAGAASLSAVAEGTKSAASAAYQISSLVSSQGVAAAGSLIALSGASIAMGAIDILRGGYGIWTAKERASILQAIANAAEDSQDEVELEEEGTLGNQKVKQEEKKKISLLARTALAKQENERDASIGKIAKGALAVAGGAVLIALGATPVGWVLLGLGGAVAGIMLLVNYIKSSKAKEAIVAEILGVKDKRKAYEEGLAKIKKDTWPFTDKRKEKMKEFQEAYPEDPLEAAAKKTEEKTVDNLYNKHINDTAHMIYMSAVDPSTADQNPGNPYLKILNGLGLKVNIEDPKNPQPSVDKIKKAISV